MGKVKIFAKAACFKNLFIIGDGESFGNWDVQKALVGNYNAANKCFVFDADLPLGKYYYRYFAGEKVRSKVYISHLDDTWESNNANSKPKYYVDNSNENDITENDEPNLRPCALLQDGETKIHLQVSNSFGTPITEDLETFSIAFMPDESLVLTETVSYNVFKFTTSTENVIKIAGTDPYFHMFSGRYENNCSITLNLTASDHEMFTAKITTSDLQKNQDKIELKFTNGSKDLCMTIHYLLVKPHAQKCIMNKRRNRNWIKEKTAEVGHRGCGNSFTTRNEDGNIDKRLLSNIRENSIKSFIAAKNIGNADMVEFDVTLTKEKTPIIYHDLRVIFHGVMTPIAKIELKDAKSAKLVDMSRTLYDHDLNFPYDEIDGDEGHCPTLEDTFAESPETLDFNVEVKWPLITEWDQTPNYTSKDFFDINEYCDIIIDTIRSSKSSRGLVFSCFNPDVCLCLRSKQCDIDVVQLVYGDTGFYADHPDTRVRRIGFAAAYAKSIGLKGVTTICHDMIQNPDLAKKLNNYGLTSGVYGDALNNRQHRVNMRKYGLTKIIYDRIHLPDDA